MPVDEDALDAIRREVYAVPPEQFLDARSAAAGRIDDADLAAAVRRLRKPTVAAWIVNAFVAARPAVVDDLTDIGGRLARAQGELDTATLRELTLERRRTVARLTAEALQHADRADAVVTLRDDVSATLDAAVADPDVAHRLGTLQRQERWSGFGAVSPAALSLVPAPRTSGRSRSGSARRTPGARSEDTAQVEDTASAEDTAELERARAALAAAEEDLARATEGEQDLQARLRRLTTRLTTLQREIATVRDDLDAARGRTAAAERERRAAHSALDRAQRG